MIRIGTIWDGTTAVIAGRLSILVWLAVVLLFVPPVAQAAVDAVSGDSGVLKFVGGLVALVVALAAIMGTLAITAVATDPAVDRSSALAIAGERLWPALGLMLIAGIVVFALMLPGVVLIGLSGVDIERMRTGLPQASGGRPGMLALAALYYLLVGAVLMWATVRLVPLMAVIVNERRGLGAFRRAFALTRGATMRLLGVLILYLIVLTVLWLAASSVVGLTVRLFAGPDHPGAVLFAVGVVAAALTAVFGVVQAVFSGQFYLAAREARDPA